MKTVRIFLQALALAACVIPQLLPAADQSAGKVRLLIVTGGHDFEKEAFFTLFKDNPEVSFEAVEHPKAQAHFKADAAKAWDVLVLYDMYQPISEDSKADLLARLNEGKGLVVLHHAIANYQQWPEYAKIIGARYYLEKTTVDGVEKARSIYKHDVNFRIKIANADHPVTRGVKDYEIRDETYNLYDVSPDAQPLLTTDEPTSHKIVGWAKAYGPARIVYLQGGHDHFAYENPSYRQILQQAIRWTAPKR